MNFQRGRAFKKPLLQKGKCHGFSQPKKLRKFEYCNVFIATFVHVWM